MRGTDDHVYGNEWTGSAWTGWIGQPGGITTTHAPAVTTRGAGLLDLFVRTAVRRRRLASFDGARWSAWKTVPGAVDSGLGAVADSPDRIFLFARRGADVIWNVYDGGTGPEQGWSGWQPAAPAAAPAPAATPTPAG